MARMATNRQQARLRRDLAPAHKTFILGVRLTPRQEQALRVAALKRDVSISEYVRTEIIERLERAA